MTNITITKVDYHNPQQVDTLINLLDEYARDPMGGAEPLADEVKIRLAADLHKQSNMFSLIVSVDDKAAGFCNCVWGYSTFAAKPLVNIQI